MAKQRQQQVYALTRAHWERIFALWQQLTGVSAGTAAPTDAMEGRCSLGDKMGCDDGRKSPAAPAGDDE